MVCIGQGGVIHRQKGNANALTGQTLGCLVILYCQHDIWRNLCFCQYGVRYMTDALLGMEQDQRFIFQ